MPLLLLATAVRLMEEGRGIGGGVADGAGLDRRINLDRLVSCALS
jgi:hypothetical protein